LYEIFNISEGILRCGDDLVINEKNLLKFLNKKTKKYDYYGQNQNCKNYICSEHMKTDLLKLKNDPFMIRYYMTHADELLDPLNNLKHVDVSLYSLRPDIYGACGAIYYISSKACKVLVRHMENINYNVLEYDTFTKSYPYTVEDCAVSFILYLNNINFINRHLFFDAPLHDTIAIHTNKYK